VGREGVLRVRGTAVMTHLRRATSLGNVSLATSVEQPAVPREQRRARIHFPKMPLLLALALTQPTPLWKLPSAKPEMLGSAMAWLAQFPPGRERTVAASRLLLGTPYQTNPLGEGTGREPGPRLRFDRVDCLTFVEEAMALGQAESASALLPRLDDLRYAGAPSYDQRNHFMMSQWVPGNEAKGYLKDLTRELAPKAGSEDEDVTEVDWNHRQGSRRIALPPNRIPIGHWSLPILSPAQTLEAAEDIPEGTLLLVVRAPRAGVIDRVTHLGLVVHSGGRTWLRHASTVYQRVVDEPLDHFVARNVRYQHPPVVGFSLLSITVPKR
jgi:hypothetical protein